MFFTSIMHVSLASPRGGGGAWTYLGQCGDFVGTLI